MEVDIFFSRNRQASYYGSFFDGEEAQLADYWAEGNLQFFHGKPHANAVAWAQSERKESVRV